MLRRNRFRLKSQILDVLNAPEWTLTKINLLFGEYGIGELRDGWSDPSLADLISNVSDEILVELYAVVMGMDIDEVDDAVEHIVDDGNWKPGYARVFLSHASSRKDFVGDVASELAEAGIHGFVAHDTLKFTKPWQSQVERALRSMQALVAVVDAEYNTSAFCQQELGWARGSRVPYFAVLVGASPAGFMQREQWPNCAQQSPKEVAQTISAWVATLPELGTTVTEGLFEALRSAGGYIDAGAVARRIAALGCLTEEQFARLDEIYWANDQVHGGALPTNALRPFYAENGRTWPPSRTAQ